MGLYEYFTDIRSLQATSPRVRVRATVNVSVKVTFRFRFRVFVRIFVRVRTKDKFWVEFWIYVSARFTVGIMDRVSVSIGLR